MQLPMLIALAMVGYLAAVTQSPITSFVIVMEMIDGHALVISLMATALISSRVSRLFAPPLYEALSSAIWRRRALHPRRGRKYPKSKRPSRLSSRKINGNAAAEDGTGNPRQ